MPKFLSASALDRITKCLPSSYHFTDNCGFLLRGGKDFFELTDSDLEKNGKYLSPCKRCHKLPFVHEIWPKAEQITLWHCSDGMEFTSEVNALRHELEIFRHG